MQCGMGVPFMAVKFHILVFWVWYGRLLNGHPSISNEPLLCTYLYDSWYENASLSSSSLYIYIYIYIYMELDGVSCLIHWISMLSSSTRIIGAPVSHVLSTQ